MSYTIASIVRRYGADVATIADTHVASDVEDFIQQLATAQGRLEDAGINGAEDLEAAATYLADARNYDSFDQQVLLTMAVKHLNPLTDLVDEYQLAV